MFLLLFSFQRLSCCLSLLLSFLCVSIAWYRPKTEVRNIVEKFISGVNLKAQSVGYRCDEVNVAHPYMGSLSTYNPTNFFNDNYF